MLHVASVPVRGLYRVLTVGWSPRHGPRLDGPLVLYVDEQVALYTQWRDVTISARRLGPIDQLVVADAPLVQAQMEAWVRVHPGSGHMLVAS